MTQFYMSAANPEGDLQRCQKSQRHREWIVITGVTAQGDIKLFEGVVQAIEDHGQDAPPNRRWRVTMVADWNTGGGKSNP